jgi:hypothetical protein
MKLNNICLNCGREIRIQIFRGGDWCSDDCRKALLGREKCSYETIYDNEVGEIDVCYVHGMDSKYHSRLGAHRPCRAVEDW